MATATSVQADIFHLTRLEKWDTVKPFQLLQPPPGQPRENLVREPRRVEITDIRSVAKPPSLEKEGFEWIKGRKLDEALDSQQSISRHIKELEKIVLAHFQAQSVFTFIQQARILPTQNQAADKLATVRSVLIINDESSYANGTMMGAHRIYAQCDLIFSSYSSLRVDMTEDAIKRRIRFEVPGTADRILAQEHWMISVWHPLFGPITDCPLAVCDSRTVDDQDLVESDFIYPNFESELYNCCHNPHHRWYYMSDQMDDDILLIVNYHSASNTSNNTLSSWIQTLVTEAERFLGVPHTGFIHPNADSGHRMRESFEIKMIVVAK